MKTFAVTLALFAVSVAFQAASPSDAPALAAPPATPQQADVPSGDPEVFPQKNFFPGRGAADPAEPESAREPAPDGEGNAGAGAGGTDPAGPAAAPDGNAADLPGTCDRAAPDPQASGAPA